MAAKDLDDGSDAKAFCSAYGSKLLLTIFCTHHLLKGFVGGGGNSGLVGHAMEFTFRGLKVEGPRLQVYVAVAGLPWSMKALMGLVSDGFPIRGRRKAPYLALSTIAATFAYGFLGSTSNPQLQAATGSFFMVYFQMALADLLVEAKYSEKVKMVPERGPDLITFVWGGIAVATLVSTVVAGALLEHKGPRACYVAALPFVVLMLWPTCCNYLEETPDRVNPRLCSPDVEVWKGKGLVPFILALVSGTAAIGMLTFSLLVDSVAANFAVAATVGFLTFTLFSFFLRPVIAKINAFFFLQSMFHIGTSGAAVYFFTDKEAQYPNGPHFSRQFYVTGMGSVAAICSLLGMSAYNVFASRWKYRSILMVSSIAYALTNCMSAIAYKRLNLEWGISDKLFMLTSSAMQNVFQQLSWMPMTVMLAQLVPHGIESVMYALLAGSLNMGTTVANYAGALVLNLLGVTPNGDECCDETAKFENLWIAALVSALGPCVPLVLVNFLIPDARQTDRLLEDGDPGSATTGSLFEQLRAQWRGRRYGQLEDASGSEVEMCSVVTPRAVGKRGDEDST
mmetsp:Transcript_21274/g.38828  ORF Transcript_21274/g.38828 Transcript_21274/m.38828 type:complete len:565 (-) Transcript_21274:9-1703(-)